MKQGVLYDSHIVTEQQHVTLLETPTPDPIRLTVYRIRDEKVIYSSPIDGTKPFVLPIYLLNNYPLRVELRRFGAASTRDRIRAKHAQENANWWVTQLEEEAEERLKALLPPEFKSKKRSLCTCPDCDYCKAGSCFNCGELEDMYGDARIRTVEHHEIVMRGTKIHYTDVARAISLACEASDRTKKEGSSDVFVYWDDENLIVGYDRPTKKAEK